MSVKRTVVDHINFRLPEDLELLFACSVILQKWTNNYEVRMRANDVSSGRVVYRLQYSVTGNVAGFVILRRLGFFLHQEPALNTDCDSLFDFSDERLLAFQDTGKHAYQIAAMMCGEDASPYILDGVTHYAQLPEIKRSKPSLEGLWVYGSIPDAHLFNMEDGEVTGIVAKASWQTYAMAAMGLGVIEILPAGRHKNWLSKWANPIYRMVEEGETLQAQIEAAKESIQKYIEMRFSKSNNESDT